MAVDSPTRNQIYTQAAELTLSGTTVTAYGVPSTTGIAVLADSGSTLSFRGEGVTLSDGNVVSLGLDGLVVSTTTALYQASTGRIVVGASSAAMETSSFALPTGPGPEVFTSSGTATVTTTGGQTLTTSISTSSGGGSGGEASGASASGGGSGGSATQASASPSGSPDAAAGLSAGKAAMMLGAVGGLVVFGL